MQHERKAPAVSERAQAPAAFERGPLWWLAIAVILLPVSAAVVEPNAVDPDAAVPVTGPALVTQLLAALGSLYVVARSITWLTPTPKDDAALRGLTRWVRALAAALGLDPKQGVQQKK